MNHKVAWVGATKDGKDYKVATCQCGWKVAHEWDKENKRLIVQPGAKPFIRLSYENEIQAAIDAGIFGDELVEIAQLHSGAHSWKWPTDAPISITGIELEQ